MQNSEFRQDMVSGDWVVVAPKRAARPEQFFSKTKRKRISKSKCPFEDPQKNGNDEPVLLYTDEKTWTLQVIPNKFPVLAHRELCAAKSEKGPYQVMEGVGHHDIVITRDHNTNFAHLSDFMADIVFKAFKERYVAMMHDACVKYVSIFHNWGASAGASIYHPHFQILSLPIIPPDVFRSLRGSAGYFEKHGTCVHCTMIGFEKKKKLRVIYENKEAIVFAPFVSREPFELRVFPKKHLPYFEDTDERTMKYIVDALQKALLLLEVQLHDPDYNFFIHTAPIRDKEKYGHYHWHIEIQPKTSIAAGFELGTGVEVNVVDPDDAVAMLRGEDKKKEMRGKKNAI
ncbi:MAG: Galactose-1-phosphate uridylyltransferase [Candidatus Wolfebacteria bacterium GW2011_GWC2_46_275]|uniref:Galactose-1-phosphate uridylyltransferase, UDPglucose--hexose-1-phosphate uridylyltransferase n=2 Tax=Candidatus Wolfeibacteriota TaxID=1752735 RepID=A0A0G4ATG9_9BACT|nr:MAG: galactose-1-phosphate uridylyltransferase, UDPglucose--hexose-1-phosphate uridylyltransferase [Candidatus Wolfebacteria bacterium GW2011_GWB1_47_1]KKU36128.1 MAG: Galactose-1-phosphate uridylyltransferase [Candidatus Wolfebacteria bacterium GW2011_GWC2_46_275]KKU59468.1 MAG: Galactose-1-phosphate uridylyltransferase [Candidatus Wolfebacteria bacterium GW2011_GWE2_47_12]KKU65985.1 MAG: Galactose-1-phosphate uridylyltransferase [Candidatus Wolfebacteria bacterium GW2011_GWD2_47_17]HAL2497